MLFFVDRSSTRRDAMTSLELEMKLNLETSCSMNVDDFLDQLDNGGVLLTAVLDRDDHK